MKNREMSKSFSKQPMLSGITLAILATLMAGGVQAGESSSSAEITSRNVQVTKGSVSATQASSKPSSDTISGNVNDSAVSNASNAIRSIAYGNDGTSQITLGTASNPVASITKSSQSESEAVADVANSQIMKKAVTASVTSSEPEISTTVKGTVNNSTLDSSGNLTQASAGGNNGNNQLSVNAVNINLASEVKQATPFNVDSFQEEKGLVTAQVGSKSGPVGVVLSVNGNIEHSSLSVNGNSTNGLATGNNASNSLTIRGDAIVADSGNKSGAEDLSNKQSAKKKSGAEDLSDNQSAKKKSGAADLSNNQSAKGAVTSQVYGAFQIQDSVNTKIDGSSLSVANNIQSSTATANTATNALTLSATAKLDAGGLLSSTQTGKSEVMAESAATLSASSSGQTVGLNNSSISLSNNSNSALAAMNTVSNTLAVAGTTLGKANQTLSNRQTAKESVTSTATTSLSEQVQALNESGSTLTISGNSTVAQALANQAINTASLSTAAFQSSGIEIMNSQSSEKKVMATAATTSMLGNAVKSGTDALNASSATMDSNSTLAIAGANTASNALNSLAGSAFGNSGSLSAEITSRQRNDGNVTATSTTNTYQMALNASSSVNNALYNSTSEVSSNVIAAKAYGNSAVNAVTSNAINTSGGAGTSIANYQSNTAAITATAAGGYGISTIGGVTNSALRSNGNQITALAIGNSSVSSIVVSR